MGPPLPCLLVVASAAALMLQGAEGLKWSAGPQNGSTIDACVGEALTLPWDITLQAGEELVDISWFYEGLSQELIATFTHGVFVALPAFSQRVQHVPEAGFILSHVTTGDAGNYTVEVIAHQGNGFIKEKKTVAVSIADSAVISSGGLHVERKSEAVYDKSSDQFCLELTCGTFQHRGQPPVDVEWITPSGTIVTSSSYLGGKYSLLLPNPVTGGNYTCRIPPDYTPAASCLSKDNSVREASLQVDETTARLFLAEAKSSHLETKVNSLTTENTQLKGQLSQCGLAHGESLHSNVSRVGFFGYRDNPLPLQVQDNDIVSVNSRAMFNQGHAYNSTTGVFTAPANGTYFFFATAVSNTSFQDDPSYPYTFLIALQTRSYPSVKLDDSLSACGSSTRSPPRVTDETITTVAYCYVHLWQGEHVYPHSEGTGELFSQGVTFGGFLMTPD